MSPGIIGSNADTDIPLPSNVRRYYVPDSTHGGGKRRLHAHPARRPQHRGQLPAAREPDARSTTSARR
jgi:hypothetical protein